MIFSRRENMPDVMPELADDPTFQALVATFNARLINAQTQAEFVGTMTLRVRVGETDFITLPTVRLITAENKAALEQARASLFATYLMQLTREQARYLWM